MAGKAQQAAGAKSAAEAGEVDPWDLVDPPDDGPSWSEKSCLDKLKSICLVLFKIAILLGLLYMFVCSLDMLSNAFRLLGGKAAGEAFTNNIILSNPIGLMMLGVLATVLVQSSSTSTSIVVSMAAADLLEIRPSIFIIMGANIGTSVTNTIVSLGQAQKRDEFRRAFGGATVHDMFNWLAVICLLPVEWLTGSFGSWKDCGVLCQISGAITKDLEVDPNENIDQDMLKVITKPFTSLIIQIDKKVLEKIAKGEIEAGDKSLIKHSCDATNPVPYIDSHNDSSAGCFIAYRDPIEGDKEPCTFMFEKVSKTWSDAEVGVCLLILALAVLIVCLILIVKLLHSLLRGRMASIIKKTVNADFPGYGKYFTGYLAIVVGAGLTMILQSSSIFTSAITPLVGVGVLKLERMYPLTLGANIGTTFTAILAALAASRDKLQKALQVALCHLFFNIIGILIWYPIPFMREIPIGLAKRLGNKTAKYRWFAVVYLFLMFLILPAAVFGLSVAGWQVALGVILPLFLFFVIIAIINILQRKRPEVLPSGMRNWECCPLACHSLKPIDRALCARCTVDDEDPDTQPIQVMHANGSYQDDYPQKPGATNDAFVSE